MSREALIIDNHYRQWIKMLLLLGSARLTCDSKNSSTMQSNETEENHNEMNIRKFGENTLIDASLTSLRVQRIRFEFDGMEKLIQIMLRLTCSVRFT